VLASGGSDGTVRLWDPVDGSPRGEPLTGHDSWVSCVTFGNIEKQPSLVSCGGDGAVVVWAEGSHRLAVPARLLSDLAARTDLLRIGPLADAISAFITDPQTSAPLSLAVKGPWGAGKTTLMKLVREQLDPTGEDGHPLRRIELVPSARGHWWQFFSWRQSRGHSLLVGDVLDAAKQSDSRNAPPRKQLERAAVWFNPWAYQTGEQVWAGFAHEMIEQVSGRMTPSDRERFWLGLNLARVDRQALRRRFYSLVLQRLLLPLILLIGIALGLAVLHSVRLGVSVFGVGGLVTSIVIWGQERTRPAASMYERLVGGSIYDQVRSVDDSLGNLNDLIPEPQYAARSGYVYLIHADLQRVIDLVATDERPLIVFIDDLDRCTPSVVLQVLEAINLFLAGELKHCVFILGIEPDVLAAHIEASYKDLESSLRQRDPLLRGEDLSWRFLDKLIQLSVRIPSPSPAALDTYLENIMALRAPLLTNSEQSHVDFQSMTTSRPAGDDSLDDVHAPATASVPTTSDERLQVDVPSMEVLEAARRTISSYRVLMSFDDPRIGSMLSDTARRVSTNPRDVKRMVNLFWFNSYVASQRLLLGTDPEDFANDLRKVLDLCELVARWPQFGDRLAMTRIGQDETLLEELAMSCSDINTWRTAVGVLVSEDDSEAAPLEELRQFLQKADKNDSISLIAQLI
jgi:hypothetical protein